MVIEKHLTLSKSDGGPDDGFASEPHEFAAMVKAVRNTAKMCGGNKWERSPSEMIHVPLRRSLYVVKDVKMGEEFTEDNIRSIRPGNGCDPADMCLILGKFANRELERGTPMSLSYVSYEAA
jgi:pseudaminic acid synthase